MADTYYPRLYSVQGKDLDLNKVVFVETILGGEKNWHFCVHFASQLYFYVTTTTKAATEEERVAFIKAWRGGTEEPMEPM